MRQTLALVVAAIYGLLTQPVVATAYYVSGSGNDNNSGLAINAAWRTIPRVNSQKLLPGDQVFFEGGMTFSGSILVPPPDSGRPTQPVFFSSYGQNRATIRPANHDDGFYAENCGGLIVSNLNFAGGGRTVSTGRGIEFFNNVATSTIGFIQIGRA